MVFSQDRNGPLIGDHHDEVDGQRVRVRSGGPEAPHVVLVHGLGLGSTYMMPVARRLALDCHVHVPDLPGFAGSGKPGHVLGFDESADLLDQWMAQQEIPRASFLGNSLGCNIAVALALRHPERVESLVLQGPMVDPAGRHKPVLLGRFLRDPQRPVVPLGLREYPRAGFRRIYKNIQMVMDDPVEKKLPHVAAPTLVVRGTRDRLVPQEWVETMVRLLPRGTLRVVPDQAHVMVYTGPLELARVALPFIRRHHVPLQPIAPGRPAEARRRAV